MAQQNWVCSNCGNPTRNANLCDECAKLEDELEGVTDLETKEAILEGR